MNGYRRVLRGKISDIQTKFVEMKKELSTRLGIRGMFELEVDAAIELIDHKMQSIQARKIPEDMVNIVESGKSSGCIPFNYCFKFNLDIKGMDPFLIQMHSLIENFEPHV